MTDQPTTDPGRIMRVQAFQRGTTTLGGQTLCCGDPTNLDGGAHPWVHISEDGPGDVYRCPECGATDVD